MSKIGPPKKLSQAIMMALNDLALVEKDSRYKIDMGKWHTGSRDEIKCNVCFAGSVMAKTCEQPIDIFVESDDFSDGWKRAFVALNEIRDGYVHYALREFYGWHVTFEDFYDFDVAFFNNNLSYEDNPDEFKNAMCDVAMMLESLGF